jgi:hypothetical protein
MNLEWDKHDERGQVEELIACAEAQSKLTT